MFGILSVEIQYLCKVRYGLHLAHAPWETQYYLLTYFDRDQRQDMKNKVDKFFFDYHLK